MLEFVERLPLARARPWLGVVFAIGITLTALFFRWMLQDRLGAGYPFLTFFPAVMLSAFLFGARAGAVAGVLGGIFAYLAFMPPAWSLKFNEAVVMAMGFYTLIVVTDIAFIHLMQRANDHLAVEREANRRMSDLKTVMFRELQHRVANKLQVIAALLSLQRRSTTDPDAQRALTDAASRVGMIGRISRALYDPNGGNVPLETFLRQVASDILDTSGAQAVVLDLVVEPQASLAPDDAVPVALIFAETLSNMLEHGFGGQGEGRIRIRVRRHGDAGLEMVAEDNGAGLPDGFDSEAAGSLGLRIATSLAKQVRGRYRLEPRPEGGTLATLRYPEAP